MEFVIVTFPTARAVRRDGRPFGRTGAKRRVETGHHRFDLGTAGDYTPAFDERNVIGTTFETPMIIPFLPLAARAAGDEGDVRRRAPKGLAAARKGATAPRARRRPAPKRRKKAAPRRKAATAKASGRKKSAAKQRKRSTASKRPKR